MKDMGEGIYLFVFSAILRCCPEFMVESLMESVSEEASTARDKSLHLPPLACEEIVNLYLKDVDRSLIRENLRLSYIERLRKLQRNVQAVTGFAALVFDH
jgi:hypothetical protein